MYRQGIVLIFSVLDAFCQVALHSMTSNSSPVARCSASRVPVIPSVSAVSCHMYPASSSPSLLLTHNSHAKPTIANRYPPGKGSDDRMWSCSSILEMMLDTCTPGRDDPMLSRVGPTRSSR